jgi:hypothetical protein
MGRGMSVEETRRKFLVGLGRQCIRFDMEGPLVAHKGWNTYRRVGSSSRQRRDFRYRQVPRSSPRRVRSSWVQVPPVELGGSRRNGQVPVQPQGWRGLSSPGQEPTGRNEDEPQRMSLVSLNTTETPSLWVTGEGRCLQAPQSPEPAISVGVGVVSTSVRHASDKRGGPSR